MDAERKFKIFVDAHCFDREYQGIRSFITGLYSTLIPKYPNLDVYFGIQNAENILRAIPCIKKENIILYSSRKPFVRFLKDIPAILKKNKFDLAHFQYMIPFGKKRCKYMITTHDLLFMDFHEEFPFFYSLSRRYLFKRAFRNSDLRTTVSEFSKERISYHFNVPKDQIHVLPLGISSTFNMGSGREEAVKHIYKKYRIRNFILCVTRIEPRKNLSLLIHVFHKTALASKGIHLVLIGKNSIHDKKLHAELTALTPDQKKHFHWIQQVEEEDLKSFYKAGLCFLFPSLAEGFGIPPLEAAASGMPVICSDQTAMSDYNFFKPFFSYPDSRWNQMLENRLEQPPTERDLKKIGDEVLSKYNWDLTAKKFYGMLHPVTC